MIGGSGDLKSSVRNRNLSTTFKWFAQVVLVAHIFFVTVVGGPDADCPDEGAADASVDCRLQAWAPGLHGHLDVIGFRTQADSWAPEEKDDHSRRALSARLSATVAFFLTSLYLENYFSEAEKVAMGEKNFGEREWASMFDWEDMSGRGVAERMGRLHIGNDQTDGGPGLDEEGSVFLIQGSYSKQDFLRFYDNLRFTMPFSIYRQLAWWPWIDHLALYGHIINNSIIVCLAIYYNVNVIMFFNLCCMCIMYKLTTYNIHKFTDDLRRDTGLMTQCDLKMAQQVTKRYKKEAQRVFLNIRSQVWFLQFVVNAIMMCIGFSTSLLHPLRTKYAGLVEGGCPVGEGGA